MIGSVGTGQHVRGRAGGSRLVRETGWEGLVQCLLRDMGRKLRRLYRMRPAGNRLRIQPRLVDGVVGDAGADIQLPEELEALVEEMAKNVHEVWAETRIKQGWTYGPERNDKQKKHPCLIPYEELPEEEKEYDRGTSVGTLKLILKLGFRITKE